MVKRTKPSVTKFALLLLKRVHPLYTIEWKRGHRRKGYTWTGDGILRMSETDRLKALHDVVHVMIASKSRRQMPEFGLGSDPANSVGIIPPLMAVSPAAAKKEEDRVCSLHWALAAYLQGVKGAAKIEEYLNIRDLPSAEEIRRYATRYRLPDDFVPDVLETRKKRLYE